MIFELLKEYVGLEKDEAQDYFTIKESEMETVLIARQWLETSTFKALMQLVEDKGGAYVKHPTNPEFHIPKAKTEVSTAAPTTVSTDEEYDLKASIESLGQLYPILLDAHGHVIDGFHRQKVNPKGPVLKVDMVDTPVKLGLARLAANVCRRKVREQEFEESITFLIGKCGLTPKDINAKTGIPLSTIYKYLPEQLKDQVKSEAGKQSGIARQPEVSVPHVEQTVKTSDSIAQTPTMKKVQDEMMQNLIRCQGCGQQVHITKAKNIDGKDLCPTCHAEALRPVACPACKLGKPFHTFKVWHGHLICGDCNKEAEKNPELYEHKFPKIELPKLEAKNHKPPVEPWKNRLEKMHPTISKMDQAMLVRLQNNKLLREQGWKIEWQKHYVLREFVSDISLIHATKKEIPVCFDGPVHEGREDKDETVRGEFTKRYALRCAEPLGLPYKDFTLTEQVRLEKQVEDAIKKAG
jgi:hypothetical protein